MVEDNFVEVTDWNYPHTEKESIRYQIFKDLWEKGYYVTCGQKFGGDFLVYPGMLKTISMNNFNRLRFLVANLI